MSTAYTREVQLPSKGAFYNGQIPDGRVTIEAMGAQEEKLFASGAAQGSAILKKVFENCVTLPISHDELVLGDRLFILLQIRAVSYGNDYRYPYRCKDCRERDEGSIDIDKIPLKLARDDAHIIFPVTLPLTKRTLELRLITGKDEDKVKQYVSRLNAKAKGQGTEMEYIYRNSRRIESIDGEKCSISEAMELYSSLKGLDTIAFRDAVDDNDVGPELWVNPTCSHCGFENGPIYMPFDSEFFRPRRRRSSVVDPIATAADLDDAPEATL